VIETYSVLDPFVHGIQQGLWLESLASDVLASRTSAVWAGQMVDLNEIDVLGVVADSTILMECKATSFGQNDAYIALVKAQQLEIDTVVFISTKELHRNVQDSVDKMDRTSRHLRLRTIATPSASKIRRELLKVLDELTGNQLAEWFGRDILFPFSASANYR
jgi:hypothetical protein